MPASDTLSLKICQRIFSILQRAFTRPVALAHLPILYISHLYVYACLYDISSYLILCETFADIPFFFSRSRPPVPCFFSRDFADYRFRIMSGSEKTKSTKSPTSSKDSLSLASSVSPPSSSTPAHDNSSSNRHQHPTGLYHVNDYDNNNYNPNDNPFNDADDDQFISYHMYVILS